MYRSTSRWSGRRANWFRVSGAETGYKKGLQGMRNVREGVALLLVGEPVF